MKKPTQLHHIMTPKGRTMTEDRDAGPGIGGGPGHGPARDQRISRDADHARPPRRSGVTDEAPDGEISALARFKNQTEHEFIQNYTRLRQDRRGLSLAEKPNGECIFLEGDNCSVQPAKPQQCREFPNLWNFPGFEKQCHAIPKLLGEEEYKQLVQRSLASAPHSSACQ